MNQVVSFLSLLSITEEQGGVKRMLHVCAEFERIARVVLDRSEKESTKRKRRSSKMNETVPTNAAKQPSKQQAPQQRGAPTSTPNGNRASLNPGKGSTPGFTGTLNGSGTQPFTSNLQSLSPSLSNMGIPIDLSNTAGFDFANMAGLSDNLGDASFDASELDQFTIDNPNLANSFNMGTFEQPFVPQALWQMPMTLEWDMADMPVMGGFDGSLNATNIVGGGGGGDGRQNAATTSTPQDQ